MKTIGLIGGMSWESSLVYYQLLNTKVKEQLGGFHSSKCIIYSVDFAEVEALQHAGNWKALNAMMAAAATSLEAAGAELIVLCTNTMHLCAEAIQAATTIPFLHIVNAVGVEINRQGLSHVALFGTKFTMETRFYADILHEQFHVKVTVPSQEQRELVHRIIYSELVHGKIEAASRKQYIKIIDDLAAKGAEGVVLGCTEIPLLIRQSDLTIPLFDTTAIHASAALAYALH